MPLAFHLIIDWFLIDSCFCFAHITTGSLLFHTLYFDLHIFAYCLNGIHSIYILRCLSIKKYTR